MGHRYGRFGLLAVFYLCCFFCFFVLLFPLSIHLPLSLCCSLSFSVYSSFISLCFTLVLPIDPLLSTALFQDISGIYRSLPHRSLHPSPLSLSVDVALFFFVILWLPPPFSLDIVTQPGKLCLYAPDGQSGKQIRGAQTHLICGVNCFVSVSDCGYNFQLDLN